MIVTNKEGIDFAEFSSILWWDHVMEAPENKRTVVFKRGILIGLKGSIISGGHICPISGVFESLLWKKDQKKARKKKISEEINRTMPSFRPFFTSGE